VVPPVNRSTAHSDSSTRLKTRLRRELRWLRLRLVGHALIMLLGGVGLMGAAAVITVPGWSRLGEPAAWVLWALLGLAVGWAVVFELIRPLRRVANLKGFSRTLEEHGEYSNLLEAATQFSSHRHADPVVRGASPELVGEIVRRASEMADATRLAPRVPLVGVGGNVVLAGVALLLWIFVGLGAPERVHWATSVLANPSSLRTVQPTAGLYAVSGDQRVAVGGDLELTVHDFVEGDEDVVLELNRTGDFWQQKDTELAPVPEDPAPYRRARISLAGIEDPFRYRFRKGTAVSGTHRVEVRERPVITDLGMRLVPPSYTGREPRELENPGGSLTVLEGTRVEIEGHASSPLRAARRLDETGAHALQADGDRFAGELVVTEDTAFRIELVDREGLSSEALTTYRLLAQPDEVPSVRVTLPAEDLPLERDLKMEIAGLAADDVGLSRLDLVYRNELETAWNRVPLFVDGDSTRAPEEILDLEVDRGTLDVAVNFVWDLGLLDLIPGDAVVYALEATDNNDLEGGQVTRSRTWRLRLPTIAEVFDLDREERQGESRELKDLLSQGQDVREDLERLNRELMKDPEPDWDKQQEIRETLERQQALREKLQDSIGDMQQQLEEFERNNAGSLELAEKMETVQELMESLQDDESLKAYLEAMEEAMEQLTPHEVQRQMEDALTDQEEFNRRLDRTIELLRQLERERQMSDLVEEVNEYLRRQDQLAELTDPGEETDPQEGDPQEGDPQEGEQQDGEQQDGDPSESGEQQSGEPQDGEQQDGEQQDDEQTPPSQLDEEELARMQEQLREETERLQERLQEALEQMQQEQQEGGSQESPSAEEMRKALEKALEQLQQEGAPSESMQDAEDQLAEGDRQEAREQQDEARRRLLSLYEVMLEGQQMMQSAQGKFAGEQLQQLAFDLLQLSHREEEVVDALRETVRGQRTRALTREQGRIHRALDGLNTDLEELARQDFNIPERLLGEMRQLVTLADDTVDELQRNRGRRSRDTAVQVMGDMNEIVIALLTAAKSAQSGGGGSGSPMPSPSEQMRQLTEDQSRLNGMTQQLRERMQQGLNAEERRQLAELQAQQQSIREQLDEIREQIDDERRVLGDLEDLGEAMERVEDDLGLGELTEDLERQQERILSRLLDAERSVRERDFAKRREGRGSEDLFRTQIGEEGIPGVEERENALRRYTAPERAPEAYQDDVRRYFRSIQRELDRREGGRR